MTLGFECVLTPPGMSESECDKLEAEEVEEDKKRRNVLKDLQTCFDEVTVLCYILQKHT